MEVFKKSERDFRLSPCNKKIKRKLSWANWKFKNSNEGKILKGINYQQIKKYWNKDKK